MLPRVFCKLQLHIINIGVTSFLFKWLKNNFSFSASKVKYGLFFLFYIKLLMDELWMNSADLEVRGTNALLLILMDPIHGFLT